MLVLGVAGCGQDVEPMASSTGGGGSAVTSSSGGGDGGAGGSSAAGGAGGQSPLYAMARYPVGQVHSPITTFVVDRLADIRNTSSGLQDDVFMKVGDSISVTTSYLHCLADEDTDLSAHLALQNAHAYFRGGDAAGATPFDRKSVATKGGQTAAWALAPAPVQSPLEQEIAAISPAVAVVMFGTNDMGWYPNSMGTMFRWYGGNMVTLVDELIGQGIVPVLVSIPARTNDPFLGLWVPTVNELVRALAQSRQVPFVDAHFAMHELPDFGLGSDGVHPNTAAAGACDFSSSGLDYGQNTRNLLTLQALDRFYEAVLLGGTPPDIGAFEPTGSGTVVDPIIIDELPFSDRRSTADSNSDTLDVYSPCGEGQSESGPEVVYRLELQEKVLLRTLVVDAEDVDVDIQLLQGSAEAASCLARNDTLIQGTIGPGTYFLVVDTFQSKSKGERPGDYLLVVTTCEPNDLDCKASP